MRLKVNIFTFCGRLVDIMLQHFCSQEVGFTVLRFHMTGKNLLGLAMIPVCPLLMLKRNSK